MPEDVEEQLPVTWAHRCPEGPGWWTAGGPFPPSLARPAAAFQHLPTDTSSLFFSNKLIVNPSRRKNISSHPLSLPPIGASCHGMDLPLAIPSSHQPTARSSLMVGQADNPCHDSLRQLGPMLQLVERDKEQHQMPISGRSSANDPIIQLARVAVVHPQR